MKRKDDYRWSQIDRSGLRYFFFFELYTTTGTRLVYIFAMAVIVIREVVLASVNFTR
jgi:hypothetical protein